MFVRKTGCECREKKRMSSRLLKTKKTQHHSAHLFFFFAFFCNSRTPPAAACCSCKLDISGFRKSLVIHAHRARPDCRVAKDCVANYFQCAEINGDMPLPNNKSPRSKECPIRRTKKAFCPRTNNNRPRSQ